MKRHNSDSRSQTGGNKRYRSDTYNDALAEGKFELRLLIPTRAAGAVIGKGGEYIKSVREKFDATLTVPDKGTPERVLTILCRREVIPECFGEVLFKLAEEQKREEIEVRVLVHQSHAGGIIGRGGSKIKELREATGAHFKVFSETCPSSMDRVVLISGPQSKLPEAVKALVDLMCDIPIKGVQRQYDASAYDPNMVQSYGGYEPDRRFGGGPPGMGRGGMGRGGMRDGGRGGGRNGGGPMGGSGRYGGGPRMPQPFEQFRGGAPSSMPPMGGGYGGGGMQTMGSGGMAGGIMQGTPIGGMMGGASGPPMQQMGMGGGLPPSMGGVGGVPPMGAAAGGPPSFYDAGAGAVPLSSTQVTIPNELGGTIIGRGGERISSIRQESGARIEVGQSYGNDERIITITGTPQQIQQAQFLLQQCVRSSEAGRRYLQEQR